MFALSLSLSHLCLTHYLVYSNQWAKVHSLLVRVSVNGLITREPNAHTHALTCSSHWLIYWQIWPCLKCVFIFISPLDGWIVRFKETFFVCTMKNKTKKKYKKRRWVKRNGQNLNLVVGNWSIQCECIEITLQLASSLTMLYTCQLVHSVDY